MAMAKTVKMADMPTHIALMVFQELNGDKIECDDIYDFYDQVIYTDVEPRDLIYPEGWYYAKGCFRNKHMTSSGIYSEVPMRTSDGRDWRNLAIYCTLHDD